MEWMYQRQSIANEKTKSHKISITGKQTNCHRHSITDEGLFGEASMTAPRCCCFIYQLSENGFWHLVLQSTLSNLAGHIGGTVCIVLFNNCLQYFVHCTFRHLCARVPLFLATTNQRLMGLHQKSATGDSSWKGSGRFLKHFQDFSTNRVHFSFPKT